MWGWTPTAATKFGDSTPSRVPASPVATVGMAPLWTERFGASVWTSGSYDPDLNLVYFGIGQTYDTGTLLEPQSQNGDSNDGLYTDSTVALDPDTGKLVWYYQHMNRDVWDLDWAFEQSLITLPIDGKPANLVVTGGKIMVFDAVDRANGKYEFSKDLGLQSLVSAIDPKTGKKIINPALEPEANVTKHFCPHSGGGRNWPATSYDPETKILYVPLYESCQDFTWVPRDSAKTAEGGSDMHFVLHPRPDSDGKMGRIEAINLQTKKGSVDLSSARGHFKFNADDCGWTRFRRLA